MTSPRGVLRRYEQLGEHELSTLSGWLSCRNRRGGFVGGMTILNAYIRLIAMAVSRFQNKRKLPHKAYKYFGMFAKDQPPTQRSYVLLDF